MLILGPCFVSEITYTVSSGTLNSSIPYLGNSCSCVCVAQKIISLLLVVFRQSEMSRETSSTHVGRTLLSVDESLSSLQYPADHAARNLSSTMEHKQLTTGWVKSQFL